MTTLTKRQPYDRHYEKAVHAVRFEDPISVAQHLLGMIDERDEDIATHVKSEERYVEVEYKAKQLLEHLQIHLRDLHQKREANEVQTASDTEWFKKPIQDLQDALDS